MSPGLSEFRRPAVKHFISRKESWFHFHNLENFSCLWNLCSPASRVPWSCGHAVYDTGRTALRSPVGQKFLASVGFGVQPGLKCYINVHIIQYKWNGYTKCWFLHTPKKLKWAKSTMKSRVNYHTSTICITNKTSLSAEWLACLTTNNKVAGSIPGLPP